MSTFKVDVTPPLGHPLLGGWRPPAQRIRDPLWARGVVLWGAGKPLVLCAVDWCELRNDAYDLWRDALAEALGSDRERMLVHCVHQHDAPYADLYAQQLLDQHQLAGAMFDRAFLQRVVQQVARAAAASARNKRPLTHLGVGQAPVRSVACNRRVELDGHVRFDRYSFTRDRRVREAPEGQIDPMLKMLRLFSGQTAMAEISCYAVHPMSRYGEGQVSADFVGQARAMRQRDHPDVLQIYLTGCAGDVTAAKYNDRTDQARNALARRLYEAMEAACQASRRQPLGQLRFRVVPLRFRPRDEGDFALPAAQRLLADTAAPLRRRIQAALTLSWRRRVARDQPIDLPTIDLGAARLVLMPAESFVQYQLAAQRMRPDQCVVTPAYGECAPGYLPTDLAEREGFVRQHHYDWVAPMPEQTLLAALRQVLAP